MRILTVIVLSALLPLACARGSVKGDGQLGDPTLERERLAAIEQARELTAWARARAAHQRRPWWRRLLRVGGNQHMPTGMAWDDPNKLYLEVHKLLKAKGDSIEAIPDKAIRRGVVELTALVQSFMPKKTSTLVRSVTFVVQRLSKDLIEGRVGSPLAYARYIEEGTGIYGPNRKPIIIMAKNRKALFWGAYNEKGGKLMATRVTNPGMKAQAPFARAMAVFIPRYTEIVNEELLKAA